MGVSYNRLWKMLIDKNMKRIEMQCGVWDMHVKM